MKESLYDRADQYLILIISLSISLSSPIKGGGRKAEKRGGREESARGRRKAGGGAEGGRRKDQRGGGRDEEEEDEASTHLARLQEKGTTQKVGQNEESLQKIRHLGGVPIGMDKTITGQTPQ